MNNEFGELYEIFNQAFNQKKKSDLTNKNNIYLSYKITKQEADNGCKKKIEYTQITKDGTENIITVEVNIPAGIQNNQDIVLVGNGNYLKDNKFSDVVIKIQIH